MGKENRHQPPALNPANPIYAPVLRDFQRWAQDQTFIHTLGMVGQTESHFPCKAAYAVAVYSNRSICIALRSFPSLVE